MASAGRRGARPRVCQAFEFNSDETEETSIWSDYVNRTDGVHFSNYCFCSNVVIKSET